MPIKTTAWIVDGKAYANLNEAQFAELEKLLIAGSELSKESDKNLRVLIDKVVTQRMKVVEILSIKDKRPRSDKGKNHAKRNDKSALNRELQDMKQ